MPRNDRFRFGSFKGAMKTVTATQMAGPKTVIQSEVMRRLMDMVGRVARQDAAVLISGETGSGKEIVARAIHQQSQRSGHAFVDVNCAAFPEHLVESELFGYEKGAFSGADAGKQGLFELAEHGTLFLDEIGELDLRVQAKLLRVLDGVPYFRLGGTRKINVDIRLIAATNRDLEGAVSSGKFRGDLYHRIAQFQLKVPPLRERPEDVAAIAQHFLEQSLPACSFTPEAIQILQDYAWPGNVRELKNVVFNVTMSAKPDTREITPPSFTSSGLRFFTDFNRAKCWREPGANGEADDFRSTGSVRGQPGKSCRTTGNLRKNAASED